MKLGPLDGFIKAFTYCLQNEAGGRTGIIFQFYAFLWIVLTSFFAVTRILSISERPDPLYLASAPIFIVILYIPIQFFWVYEKNVGIERRRVKELNLLESVTVDYRFAKAIEMGFSNMLYLRVNNPTEKTIENIWIRSAFPANVRCDKPVLSLGDLKPMSSLTNAFSFIPLVDGNISMGYYELYLEIDNHKHQRPPVFFGNVNIDHSYLVLDFEISEPLKLGHSSSVTIRMKNYSNSNLTGLHVKCYFAQNLSYDTAFSDTVTMAPGSSHESNHTITPQAGGMVDLGHFDALYNIQGVECRVAEVAFGEHYIQTPEINVRVNMPDTLYSEVGNTISIYVDNNSEDVINNVCFISCFTSFIECHESNVCIPMIQPHESGYISLNVKPINSGKLDFGNLNYSFEVNEVVVQQEPIDLGTHNIA